MMGGIIAAFVDICKILFISGKNETKKIPIYIIYVYVLRLSLTSLNSGIDRYIENNGIKNQ